METLISIGERLKKVRENMELSQSAFAKIAENKGVAGATRQSQANYEKGKQVPGAEFLAAIAEAGADVHYILTGQTKQDQLLKAIKEATSKAADLPLINECKAAIAQLLTGLQVDNMNLITDALDIIRSDYVGLGNGDVAPEEKADYANDELTTAEKDIIEAYRKAAQPDKAFMERLAQLVEKDAMNEE